MFADTVLHFQICYRSVPCFRKHRYFTVLFQNGTNSIRLGITNNATLGKEGYTLDITDKGITAGAPTETGLYWATRSVLQMLQKGNGSAPCGSAMDIPRYQVRSFLFDVGRLPIPMSYVKDVVKYMAWYKMNDLHIHLNDNYIFHEEYVDKGENPFEKSYSAFRLESDMVGENGTRLTADDLAYSKDEFREFIAFAKEENLEAYRVAVVTEEERMVMKWKGNVIANLSRAFLDTNGAVKHTDVDVTKKDLSVLSKAMFGSLREMAADLRTASQRGLVERFDSTIGAGSVIMPYGGKRQLTPAQSMAAVLPVLPGQETDQASVFSWGCDPDHLSVDPYTGAHAAIYNSVAKLVAAGCDYKKTYLTLQEFFEKLKTEPERWGKPFAALLGALDAQLELGAAAIGGKDSMSGSFLDKDVPPTLISFAIAPIKKQEVIR